MVDGFQTYLTDSYTLIEDKPLESLDLDEFGRRRLAELMANSISDVCSSGHNCVIYGIYGKWGEGKTTLMNFVEKELLAAGRHDSICLAHFNPWILNNEQALIKDFFEAIALDQGATLKKLIRKYGNLVSFASRTIINAACPGVGVRLATFFEGVKNAIVGLDDSIAEQKKKVSDAIVKSGKQCVVFIDDIDRLDKDELHTIFRLLRQVADFRNTVYVVAMDVDIVAKSIGDFFGEGRIEDGRRYVEKIIQIPVVLPTIPDKLLERSLNIELTRILSHYDVSSDRIEEISGVVAPILKTKRDILRYVNQLSFVLPTIHADVCIEDLCALEAIKVRNPMAYDKVRESKNGLLRQLHSKYVFDREKVTQEENDAYDKAVDTICAYFDSEDARYVRDIVEFMFGNSKYEHTKHLDDRRIQTNLFFPLYFIQSIPEEILPYEKIVELGANVLTWPQEKIIDWVNDSFSLFGEDEVLRAVYSVIRSGDAAHMSERSGRMIVAMSLSNMAKGFSYDSLNNPTGVAVTISSVIINQYMFQPVSSPREEPVRDTERIAQALLEIFSAAEMNYCMSLIANNYSPLVGLRPEEEKQCISMLASRFVALSHSCQMRFSKYVLYSLFEHWKRCERETYDKYIVSLIEDESVDYLDVLKLFIQDDHMPTDVTNFVIFFEKGLPMLNKRIREDKREEADIKERRVYWANFKVAMQNLGLPEVIEFVV